MDIKKATKKRKSHSRVAIAEQIDLVLSQYKNGIDKKKYEKSLKKASKTLSKVVIIPVAKKVNRKRPAVKSVSATKA